MSRNGELPTDSVGEEDIVSTSRESLEQHIKCGVGVTNPPEDTDCQYVPERSGDSEHLA